MRGKLLFVAGLATGYVFGSRAGRQRYEQIKSGWLSFYNTAPVQSQVTRVQGFAKARVSQVPALLATGVRGLARVISSSEPRTTQAPAPATSTTAAKTASANTTSAKTASAKTSAAKKSSAKSAASTKAATTKSAAAKPATKKTATPASDTAEKQS